MPYIRTFLTPTAALELQPSDLYEDLPSTYRELASIHAKGPVRSWKLGGTTATTRRIFQVSELYFGPLLEGEVFDSSGSVIRLPLFERKAEIEIGLRIAPGGHGFDAWTIVAELPSSPIVGLVNLGVRALVADRCAAGALVIGEPQPLDSLPVGTPARPHLRIDMSAAGQSLCTGVTDQLVDGVMATGKGFLDLCHASGFAPGEGQWVATGGLTPCVPIPVDTEIDVRLDGSSVLAFRLSPATS